MCSSDLQGVGEPDDRYSTAVEFADALTVAEGGGEGSGGLFGKLKGKFT